MLDGETKNFKLLTDLKCEKHSSLNDIAVLESKLIKLEVSPERTDRIKIWFYYFKSKSNLKQYVNHVLLGFFMSV